jgi:hypothetical protein
LVTLKSIEGDDMDVTSDDFSAFSRNTLSISSTPLDAACTEISKKHGKSVSQDQVMQGRLEILQQLDMLTGNYLGRTQVTL